MLKYLTAALAAAMLVVPAAQADRLSARAADRSAAKGAPSRGASHAAEENAVVHWSLISQNAISAGRPPASSEVLHGLVHAAIYDAVVAVEGDFDPFAVSIRPQGPTSVDAAVAAAARGVLVVRVPAQAASVDAEYTTFLAGIPDGTRKTNGIRLGRAVAGACLGLRADDGYDNVVPYVQPPTGPGVFEPIPAGSTPVDVKLKQVRPLSFDDPSRFRPDGPDPLTSADYTADFKEVKALGRVDSTVRTAEQTEIARFWSEHAMIHWSRTVRNLALARGLDTLESARMMAMVHVSAADTLVGCWEAKYHYNFWRPQHAIRRADTDGNPDTEPEATWTHLILNNHPEYPSGHACITSAVTHALAEFFGTDRVLLTIDGTVTGTTHDFERLKDVRREVAVARIYGGLHFRKAVEDGEQLGRRTTRFVLRNFFGKR
jgi:hypothetical protein